MTRSATLVITCVMLLMAACGASDPIQSASSCDDLTAAMSEALDSLTDGGTPEAVDEVYAVAAERAEEILRATPDDSNAEACERIMRAVRDSETDKLFGE